MNNINVMMNTSIISYFKTGNPVVDGIILMMIATLTSYLLSKKNQIINQMKNVFRNCRERKFKYKIKLLSCEVSGRRYPIKHSSIAYNAVNYCIKNTIKCEIHEISENYDSFEKFNEPRQDVYGDIKINDKIGYDITQSDIFHIENCIHGLYDIEMEDNKEEKNTSNLKTKNKYLSLMSNTGMIDIDLFIKKCIKIFDDFRENETNKGPFIFTYTGNKNNTPIFEEKYFRTSQNLSNSIFDNKYKLENAIKKFNNDDYYIKHPHITRKFIPLLYGNPGTGKTFAIRLIASELKRNIIVIPLNKIKNLEELNSVLFFYKINNYTITPNKCVFVIEDLDAMTELLKNRKNQNIDKKQNAVSDFMTLLAKSSDNVKDKKNNNDSDDNDNNDDEDVKINSTNSTLTMSDVLNTLDGIYKLDNYVITFSTNHIEHLDPAFLRDQRITHKIEFKKCSRQVLQKIIEQWYDVKLSKNNLSKLKDNTLTLANIATICDRYDTSDEVINFIG